jgi:uncharacterized protein (DUF488 family)
MIYTLGHSIRSLDEFLSLLNAHRITRLADVRTVPGSRRHPQFGRDSLARSLSAAGIEYRHFPGLGGLRKPRADSSNTAWQNAGFRGYADYMETPAFEQALDELIEWANGGSNESDAGRVAVMCAEAVWWRCHRQLIADALVARGIPVAHIVGPGPANAHQLTSFASVSGTAVRYPGLT